MDVQVLDSGPCRRTLTIKISPENIREHLDSAFQEASKQVQLKGFRPGKVPRQVLEKRYGDAIRAEAKENLINKSYESACDEHGLKVVGRPELEGLDEKPLDQDAGMEFQIHVEVRPELELGEVTGVEIQAEDTAVTEEDIDKALSQIADQKKTLNTVEEPVDEGDFVKVDLKKLQGTEKGSKFDIELTFPEAFEVEEVRGAKGKVKIEVHEVLRVQAAPIDDALAKDFDFDSLDALREELQGRIGEEKVKNEERRQEDLIIDTILNDHPFVLPESLLANEIQHRTNGLKQRMENAKVAAEEIEKHLESAKPELEKDSERGVRQYFLLDSIARKEKIFVTENDVDVELRNIAAQNNVPPDEVREHYEKNNLVTDLRLGLMERKVREYLREKAKITDK
ncbi:MAG: trigger factor [Planctomycetota bacterium]|jgi:trigger factor